MMNESTYLHVPWPSGRREFDVEHPDEAFICNHFGKVQKTRLWRPAATTSALCFANAVSLMKRSLYKDVPRPSVTVSVAGDNVAMAAAAIGNKPLLVLEDDAAPTPELVEGLRKAMSALPADAHVLYLGYSPAAHWRHDISPHLVESEYVWATVG